MQVQSKAFSGTRPKKSKKWWPLESKTAHKNMKGEVGFEQKKKFFLLVKI
jgi:hypothetical protein